MSEIKAILFDLDGTLSDPSAGITRCIQHALSRMGRPHVDCADLVKYIGPPLRETFATLLETDDDAHVEQAVAAYRERFGREGLYENRLYPGTRDMLRGLAGHRVFLATSKPLVYASRILYFFDLNSQVERAYGSGLDGKLENKVELIGHIIESEALVAENTAMVGDRHQDMVGAVKNGAIPIGATYGFGSEEELTDGGAHVLCRSPGEVATFISAAVA